MRHGQKPERVRREYRELRNETPVVDLERSDDRVGDLPTSELLGGRLLVPAYLRGEAREDLARVDQHHADVMTAKLVAPALRHAPERELGRTVGGGAAPTP